jgi:hypothetical protein
MASMASTETDCSTTSSELLQLLVSFAKHHGESGTGARSDRMGNYDFMIDTPTYVEGIINMHGKLIPIISLRK